MWRAPLAEALEISGDSAWGAGSANCVLMTDTVRDPPPSEPAASVYRVQAGRRPQAIPWALKASQIRQPFGVPLARLPSSSSTAR
jgi:hypothetical protein